MKLQIPIHKLILIVLINYFPKSFARFYKEYQEVKEEHFKDKEIKK